MDILISIKPTYVARILNKTKWWEFRKAVWKQHPIGRVYIYASAPSKKIVASFRPGAVFEGGANLMYETFRTEGVGVTKEELLAYIKDKGYAIEITDLKIFTEPIDPYKKIVGFRPPQSFCYFDGSVLGDNP